MSILEWARKVQGVAQSGLAFSPDPDDRKRYEQLQELVATILSSELTTPIEETRNLWHHEQGYATPKVDVRGAIFADEKVLLVRERSDGKWTLPGGWVDINDSPSEAVVREIYEESGYHTKAIKLAALYDRTRHPHPPMLYHLYKIFFLCEITGGKATTSDETDAVGFFGLEELPELSLPRVTRGQVERLFEHNRNKEMPTDFD
ncbi:MAG: NUDIX hydrolase [Ignavibacteriae bacterium]|nr:NUDIX hydrolase [Ignavibacteriota bacterium]MCB9214554.1 NUDIX hydrolase [Ignavibacteria bacterium]